MESEPIEQNDEESFDKPSYDARLQYYKILGGFMKGIAEASLANNYDGWFNLLSCMFDLLSAFIRNKDRVLISSELDKVEKKVYESGGNFYSKNTQYILNRTLERELHKVTRLVYTSSKHMLLPISESEDTEYSSEAFFAGSDL